MMHFSTLSTDSYEWTAGSDVTLKGRGRSGLVKRRQIKPSTTMPMKSHRRKLRKFNRAQMSPINSWMRVIGYCTHRAQHTCKHKNKKNIRKTFMTLQCWFEKCSLPQRKKKKRYYSGGGQSKWCVMIEWRKGPNFSFKKSKRNILLKTDVIIIKLCPFIETPTNRNCPLLK